MNYNQILEELYSLENIKFTQTLVNMRVLLKKLNNPEKKLKCVHVAGTNGKGSVCAMLNSILTDAGYKVGMYTSPHLKKFNERIKINDKLISDKDIIKYYLKIKNYVTAQTFFEITTAMAFIYFKEKKVDFAIIETGLGGRLDSTNVITPLISIITNVGIEHTEYLGNTLEKIASEKGGIIKENVPVVTAASGQALATIKKISNKKCPVIKDYGHPLSGNSKLIIINKNKIKIYCNKNYTSFDIDSYKNLKFDNLNGSFQIENAAIAVKAIQTIKNNYNIKINKKNIINGLKNAKWPGRFQFIDKNILIDSAHNPSGFKALFNELKNINYNKLILVIGFSDDKDIKTISKIISTKIKDFRDTENPEDFLVKSKADKIIITKSKNERAEEPVTIKKYFNKNSIIINNPKKALNYARKIATKKDLILITGSIFLVGELL